MSICDVKRAIRDGNDTVEQGQRILREVATEATAVHQLAQLTVHDSVHDDAQAGLKILAGIEDEIGRTLRRFKAARDHADAYLAALG